MKHKSMKRRRRRRRGLFPWRPKFPSFVTDDWKQWYKDWIVNGPMPARLKGHRSK